MGIIALALCIFAVPGVGKEWVYSYADIAIFRYPLMAGLWAAAIAFFIALYHAMKLLSYIDKNTAFSELSVKALQKIKQCAVVIAVLFGGGLPFAYYFAQREDAPGFVLFGLVFIGATFSIAMFAAVLERLLKNAIEMKSENELTV